MNTYSSLWGWEFGGHWVTIVIRLSMAFEGVREGVEMQHPHHVRMEQFLGRVANVLGCSLGNSFELFTSRAGQRLQGCDRLA